MDVRFFWKNSNYHKSMYFVQTFTSSNMCLLKILKTRVKKLILGQSLGNLCLYLRIKSDLKQSEHIIFQAKECLSILFKKIFIKYKQILCKTPNKFDFLFSSDFKMRCFTSRDRLFWHLKEWIFQPMIKYK